MCRVFKLELPFGRARFCLAVLAAPLSLFGQDVIFKEGFRDLGARGIERGAM